VEMNEKRLELARRIAEKRRELEARKRLIAV